MRRLTVLLLLPLLLVGGCQDRTGFDWLDPLVVRNFDKRVELTKAVRRSRYSYCFYGCDHVCSIVPEPTIYRDLDEQNYAKMSEVRDRAKRSGLVFDVHEKSGIIYDPRHPPELSPEEIGPAKLICLQRQREDIEEIESLLNELAPKGS